MRFLSFRKPRSPRGNVRASRRGNPIFNLLAIAALFGACVVLVVRLDSVGMRSETGPARIIDGDTMDVRGQRIRLSGIDAFELGQTCMKDAAEYDCGQAAKLALSGLTAGQTLRCDGNRLDRYRRLLAVCMVGEMDLNHAMVNAGWAVSYGAYRTPEIAARMDRRGAWAGAFDAPTDWRARKGAPHEVPHDLFNRIVEFLKDTVGKLLG